MRDPVVLVLRRDIDDLYSRTEQKKLSNLTHHGNWLMDRLDGPHGEKHRAAYAAIRWALEELEAIEEEQEPNEMNYGSDGSGGW